MPGGTNPANYYAYSYWNTQYNQKRYLDIDTIDNAEAMVFWLGGFPTPVNGSGQPMASRKLIGFNSDPTNPFSLDMTSSTVTNPTAFLQNRTTPLYQFDESRLVDADSDGFWEYVPNFSGSSDSPSAIPPYVYFDASLYSSWTTLGSCCVLSYPGNGKNPPVRDSPQFMNPQLIASPGDAGGNWGVAMPVASSVTSPLNNGIITWKNPTSYQIICAGQDLHYSPTQYTSAVGAQYDFTGTILPSFPHLLVIDGNISAGIAPGTVILPGGQQVAMQPEHEDNLTNISTMTLYDYVQGVGS
jgi:hypothetical protein